jgi:hypothetical protein
MEFEVGDKVKLIKTLEKDGEKFKGTLEIVALQGGVVRLKNDKNNILTLNSTRFIRKVN